MLHATLRSGQVRAWRGLAMLLLVVLVAGAPAAAAQDTARASASAAALLADSGRHLEAAALYERLARRGFLSWDATYALLAARQYAVAGEYDEAERLLGRARRASGPDTAVLLARVAAEIALGQGDPRRALDALRALPPPWPVAEQADLLALRGRAEFSSGQVIAGLRTFGQRGESLVAPGAREANDELLLDLLLRHPTANAAATPGLTERERGWLELADLLIYAGSAAGPADTATFARVRDWLRQHPGHPGTAFLPEAAATSPGLAVLPSSAPATVALLVPLSGRQQAAGIAVRDGAVGAWFAAGAGPTRPRLVVFDTAALGAAAAYERALAAGAQLVVGPLTREDVTAVVIARQGVLPVPTMTLNLLALPAGELPPVFLFQFTLDPEQEARAAARRIAADGLVRGVALFPDSTWGQRVREAFVAELQATGSIDLSAALFYEPGVRDFSAPLRAALGRFGGAGERARDTNRPLAARDASAERLAGPQFAFIAATPQAMRAIKPQLRFQMTYDLPIYSTADAWDPSLKAASEMDGLIYPEMPWILYGGQGAPELWDALHDDWAAAGRGRLRLYAFGHDAYTLASQLRGSAAAAGIDGLTGILEMDSDGRVRRSLQFALVAGGRPQAAGSSGTGYVAEPPANSAGAVPAD